MGLYDSVNVNCWQCGEVIELQSKSGNCIMNTYTLNDVPPDVIGGLAGEEGVCPKCGSGYKIVVRVSAWMQPNNAWSGLVEGDGDSRKVVTKFKSSGLA